MPHRSMREIIVACSIVSNIDRKSIVAPTKYKEHNNARRAITVVALARGYSLNKIAREVGRHVATIRYHIDNRHLWSSSDELEVSRLIELIEQKLEQPTYFEKLLKQAQVINA